MVPIRIVLMSVFLLNACSTMPSSPRVMTLPGTGKSFEQFHNDDMACRQLVHEQVTTAQKDPDSTEEGQQDYDIAYIQCMYGKGHRVPVPWQLMYNTQQDWNPPPPPHLPAPQTTRPGSSVTPAQ